MKPGESYEFCITLFGRSGNGEVHNDYVGSTSIFKFNEIEENDKSFNVNLDYNVYRKRVGKICNKTHRVDLTIIMQPRKQLDQPVANALQEIASDIRDINNIMGTKLQ